MDVIDEVEAILEEQLEDKRHKRHKRNAKYKWFILEVALTAALFSAATIVAMFLAEWGLALFFICLFVLFATLLFTLLDEERL